MKYIIYNNAVFPTSEFKDLGHNTISAKLMDIVEVTTSKNSLFDNKFEALNMLKHRLIQALEITNNELEPFQKELSHEQ